MSTKYNIYKKQNTARYIWADLVNSDLQVVSKKRDLYVFDYFQFKSEKLLSKLSLGWNWNI